MKINDVIRAVLLSAGLVAAATAGSAPLPATNLVTNGGFESGLTGWTPAGFVALGYDYGIDAASHGGVQAFYGGGVGTPGYLLQTFATAPGVTYAVTLWLASDGFLPNELQVLWNGGLVFDQIDTLLADYARITFDVPATSISTLFAIGLRDDAGALHVDDVSVTAVSEPASISLMLIGAGLALSWRRRARKASSKEPDAVRQRGERSEQRIE